MKVNNIDDLYSDYILDHCRHPRNHNFIENYDVSGHDVNPFCGDEVDLQLVLDNGRVSGVGVQSVGCSINQASASMLSEVIGGRSMEEIHHLLNIFKNFMKGLTPPENEVVKLGDVRFLSEVQKFPVRIKCALLAWSALEGAIE